jgi:hypothetical protein
MRSLLALLLLVTACGSNQTPPTTTAAAAPSTSASPSTSAPEMKHEAPRPPPAGKSVTVAYDGRQVDVDVAGASPMPALDIWKKAFPDVDASGLTFDLVGTDGFRPTSRKDCTHLLSATEMAAGKVDPASHDIAFDDSLKLGKCYRVKALARIEAKK